MIRKPILLCSGMALLLAASAATRPTQIQAGSVGDDVVILGKLGIPVGQDVTIAGHKKRDGPVAGTFFVDTIDGKAASNGTRVEIAGIAAWPDGTAATLTGCEVGTLRFLYAGETNLFGPDDDRWQGPHQYLFLGFKVSEVVKPATLKLSPAE